MVRVQLRKPFANREMVDLFNRNLMTSMGARNVPVWLFCGREKLEELVQIAFIIAQRMRADISFIAQVIEELSEKLINHIEAPSRLAMVVNCRSVRTPDFSLCEVFHRLKSMLLVCCEF